MSDLRFNSAAGALLATCLGVMGVGVGAETLVRSHTAEKAGYLPEVAVEAASGGGAPAAPAGPPDFGRLFADQAMLAELVGRGERQVAACASCHNFAAGGPNGTGPNLHDVFGRQAASHAGFAYSDAMKAHSGVWDYLRLNEFLTAPQTAVPGTKMSYAGIRNERDRVAVIAYLRSISPNSVALPAPLPEAASSETPATAAPPPA